MAYAMPSIFYANCDGRNEGLKSLTCAGRAVMHRRKIIAHARKARLIHPHGVAIGGDAVELDPSKDARLVHARRGRTSWSKRAASLLDAPPSRVPMTARATYASSKL